MTVVEMPFADSLLFAEPINSRLRAGPGYCWLFGSFCLAGGPLCPCYLLWQIPQPRLHCSAFLVSALLQISCPSLMHCSAFFVCSVLSMSHPASTTICPLYGLWSTPCYLLLKILSLACIALPVLYVSIVPTSHVEFRAPLHLCWCCYCQWCSRVASIFRFRAFLICCILPIVCPAFMTACLQLAFDCTVMCVCLLASCR